MFAKSVVPNLWSSKHTHPLFLASQVRWRLLSGTISYNFDIFVMRIYPFCMSLLIPFPPYISWGLFFLSYSNLYYPHAYICTSIVFELLCLSFNFCDVARIITCHYEFYRLHGESKNKTDKTLFFVTTNELMSFF